MLSKEQEAEFNERGYIILRGALSARDLEVLRVAAKTARREQPDAQPALPEAEPVAAGSGEVCVGELDVVDEPGNV